MSTLLETYTTTLPKICCQMVVSSRSGHYIEVLFIEKIAELLNEWKKENAWSLEVITSQASTNPFHHI